MVNGSSWINNHSNGWRCTMPGCHPSKYNALVPIDKGFYQYRRRGGSWWRRTDKKQLLIVVGHTNNHYGVRSYHTNQDNHYQHHVILIPISHQLCPSLMVAYAPEKLHIVPLQPAKVCAKLSVWSKEGSQWPFPRLRSDTGAKRDSMVQFYPPVLSVSSLKSANRVVLWGIPMVGTNH